MQEWTAGAFERGKPDRSRRVSVVVSGSEGRHGWRPRVTRRFRRLANFRHRRVEFGWLLPVPSARWAFFCCRLTYPCLPPVPSLYPRQELEPWAGMALIEGGCYLLAPLVVLAAGSQRYLTQLPQF